jgi:predicted nucleic-acid-binding Zn-ribbon protein
MKIYCPKCNETKWEIDVASQGKKKVITIVCMRCGYTQQYRGVGESIPRS